MPSLLDDGRTATLDLHGATVHEAHALIPSIVAEAARRGRVQVKIIQGAPTSSRRYRNRTIKHTLYHLLDGGVLAGSVTGTLRREGHTVLSLDVTAALTDDRRLRLSDVW